MRLVATASQTVGPFFYIGLGHLCNAQRSLETIPAAVHGKVLDALGVPVPDAVLELWQANTRGHYVAEPESNSGAASGFARIATDDQGCFSFNTCRPGAVPFDSEQMQAPHIVVLVFCRGLLRHLMTRMYFPDEPANDADPVLQSLPADRRRTLIASKASPDTLEWNIVLQGEDETVFFAW